jgi:pyruvate/2-oxoglutarate/acetoin dehydrogenase E1 component
VGVVLNYHDSLSEAMARLATREEVIFLGQGVGVPGTTMSTTFRDVPKEKLIEMPVAEEMQVGMCIGMALKGFIPICIIPRWNFMLRAADQIVNHLDRLPLYSAGGFRPKVIIRTAVPSVSPFNPQAQHDADFTSAFKLMCRTIHISSLISPESIIGHYEAAIARSTPSILVEHTEMYKNARAAA